MKTQDEKICDLEIDNAVLHEKIKRLETIIYTTISFAALQLLGMFFMWLANLKK